MAAVWPTKEVCTQLKGMLNLQADLAGYFGGSKCLIGLDSGIQRVWNPDSG